MTYNVFGGTLNLALSIYQYLLSNQPRTAAYLMCRVMMMMMMMYTFLLH